MDYMAPYHKMTPKEIKLEQMPWVTRGILVSMIVLYIKVGIEKKIYNLKLQYLHYINAAATSL